MSDAAADGSGDGVLEELLQDGLDAFSRGEYREARKHFSQAALRRPEDARAQYWLGVSQYHLGRIGDAVEHLERAVRADEAPLPRRPAAAFEYLCRCHLSSDPDRARELGERGLAIDPDDPRVRVATGDACLRMKRHAAALSHYDAARAAEEIGGAGPAFPERPGRVPFARSSALLALERWQEALEAVELALEREPDNAAYHNRRGVVLFDGLERAEEAVAAARRALELDPRCVGSGGDGAYAYNLAVYLRALDRDGEALEALDRAIALSPRRRYKALRRELLEVVQEEALAETAARPALDFSDVGGMGALKEQVRRIIDVVHRRRQEASRYGIVRNGILLYGPPGCGKTFFAEAMAGEFGLELLRVNLGDAVSKYVGSAGETLERLFRRARESRPCLLFFDEFDAIAGRRDDLGTQHEQQVVNALLQQIDAVREVPGIVVAAATNRLHQLDPAAIRDGRFDYKVKVYRPDFDARREILEVVLRDRPHHRGLDLTELAQDMEGFTAAQIRGVVDAAAMAAMEANAEIGEGHLREALRRKARARGWTGPALDWDDLVLPPATKRQLQFIERFIENPGLVRELGVEPPSGVLLHGPPGTGKTTIARVLASQTDASFFAVNASDVFSKWLGESEQRVKELFEQARDNVPALIFIDEIDAVLAARAETSSGAGRAANSVVNTFLAEMDGVAGAQRIFVIGATNRPELVDDAVLRPGRLSDVIEIGLPDRGGRRRLLELFAGRMKLAPDVDLDALADETDGASGADLRGLCTAAGRVALLRELDDAGGDSPAVTAEDFGRALEELFPERAWERRSAPIGFRPGAA